MLRKEIIVEKDKKLVTFLQDFGFTYADVNKMLRNKDVKVNGKVERNNVLLCCGDKVVFYYQNTMLEKKYEIVFQDEQVLIVYKFAGIETAGEKGLESILNVIAVHRLDRNTEGLIVFAKNQSSAKLLEKAFKHNLVHKFYLAEVVGCFQTDKQYNAFLVKDSENSNVKIYDKEIKGAVAISTRVKTVKAGSESSLVEVELLTGKTHQIRAHLAYLGHPIIGDGKYGKNENNKKFQVFKQKLACFLIKFDYIGISSLDFKEFKHDVTFSC